MEVSQEYTQRIMGAIEKMPKVQQAVRQSLRSMKDCIQGSSTIEPTIATIISMIAFWARRVSSAEIPWVGGVSFTVSARPS